MPAKTPRVPVHLTAEQEKKLGKWSDMNFVRVMSQNPDLNAAFTPLIAKVVAHTKLPARDRQVLCLRTLTLGNDVYEVTHHELISKCAGLNEAEIKQMRQGEGPDLTPFDKVLIQAAEQLVRDQYISDEVWAAMAERYTTEQLMEVVVLTGAYLVMAMVTRNFDMELEDDETFNRFAEMREYT